MILSGILPMIHPKHLPWIPPTVCPKNLLLVPKNLPGIHPGFYQGIIKKILQGFIRKLF